MVGGPQSDLIYAGVNELGGGAVTDANIIYGDSQLGGELGEDHRDRIFGDIGPDTVYAGASSDTVYTLSGNDIVYAGDGNDFLDTSFGAAMT